MSKFVNRAALVEMLKQKGEQLDQEFRIDYVDHYIEKKSPIGDAYRRAALLVETFNDKEAEDLETSCKNLGPAVGKFFK